MFVVDDSLDDFVQVFTALLVAEGDGSLDAPNWCEDRFTLISKRDPPGKCSFSGPGMLKSFCILLNIVDNSRVVYEYLMVVLFNMI